MTWFDSTVGYCGLGSSGELPRLIISEDGFDSHTRYQSEGKVESRLVWNQEIEGSSPSTLTYRPDTMECSSFQTCDLMGFDSSPACDLLARLDVQPATNREDRGSSPWWVTDTRVGELGQTGELLFGVFLPTTCGY